MGRDMGLRGTRGTARFQVKALVSLKSLPSLLAPLLLHLRPVLGEQWYARSAMKRERSQDTRTYPFRRVSLSSNRADSESAILEQERHNASALHTSRAGNEDKELARHLRDMDEYLYVVSLRTTCLLTCM